MRIPGPNTIRADILRLEAAILVDRELLAWKQSGMEFMSNYEEVIYSRYRAYPHDIRRDIDLSIQQITQRTLAVDPP